MFIYTSAMRLVARKLLLSTSCQARILTPGLDEPVSDLLLLWPGEGVETVLGCSLNHPFIGKDDDLRSIGCIESHHHIATTQQVFSKGRIARGQLRESCLIGCRRSGVSIPRLFRSSGANRTQKVTSSSLYPCDSRVAPVVLRSLFDDSDGPPCLRKCCQASLALLHQPETAFERPNCCAWSSVASPWSNHDGL